MSKAARAVAPWVLAAALLGVIVLLVAPWGDYPVNDDWQYARVARNFAATGHLNIDVEIAPALVGQVLMAWPLIRLFGFSHVVLRVATLGMSLVVLWAVDALLELAGTPRRVRLLALVLLVINPLWVNLACSFMTELWGYAPALVGAVLWFRSRRAADADGTATAVGLPAALLVGVLVATTFWTRQYCILVYPALVAATLARIGFEREGSRLRESLLAIAPASVAFATIVLTYFAWIVHGGGLGRGFSQPLDQLLWFSPSVWVIEIGLQLIYLAAFFLPLLAIWPRDRERSLWTMACCSLALGLGTAGYALIRHFAPDDAGSFGLHRVFPFASNVIHNAGVGPVTLSDVTFAEHRYRVLPRGVWRAIGLTFVGATALWGLPARSLRRLVDAPGEAREVATFGALFAALSLLAFVQSSGAWSFDRYSFPVMLGTALWMPILYAREQEILAPGGRGAGPIAAFGLLAAPLAFFTVAGVHDYFRWNDARWRLVARAIAAGVPTTSIDGGYEVNGWLSFDALKAVPDEQGCIGPCRCDVPAESARQWVCHDDSHRVAASVARDYVESARESPRYWLPAGPQLYLSRRR